MGVVGMISQCTPAHRGSLLTPIPGESEAYDSLEGMGIDDMLQRSAQHVGLQQPQQLL